MTSPVIDNRACRSGGVEGVITSLELNETCLSCATLPVTRKSEKNATGAGQSSTIFSYVRLSGTHCFINPSGALCGQETIRIYNKAPVINRHHERWKNSLHQHIMDGYNSRCNDSMGFET